MDSRTQRERMGRDASDVQRPSAPGQGSTSQVARHSAGGNRQVWRHRSEPVRHLRLVGPPPLEAFAKAAVESGEVRRLMSDHTSSIRQNGVGVLLGGHVPEALRGEDVAGVSVEVHPGPVVAHGGAWVGVPGGDARHAGRPGTGRGPRQRGRGHDRTMRAGRSTRSEQPAARAEG
jgi:hypothetical protein